MPYKLPDGRLLSPDSAFTFNEIQYPAGWLRCSTADDRVAIGITWEPDPAQPSWDQRFYWGVDNPKDHAQLQELWVGKTKEIAGSLLNQFDWYVVRQAETGKAIPQEVLDYRAAVRTQSDNREVMINGTADTDALATVITSDFGGMFPWPRGPFDPEPVADEPEATPEPVFSGGTILGDAGDDTLSFDGGTTSAGIV
jgi:hypothetical protein